MRNRKQIYDTHNLHRRTVVHHAEYSNPKILETIILKLLHEYRYHKINDTFKCDINIIFKAFDVAVDSLNKMKEDKQSIEYKINRLNTIKYKLKKKIKSLK
jgi:hypothetical protein